MAKGTATEATEATATRTAMVSKVAKAKEMVDPTMTIISRRRMAISVSPTTTKDPVDTVEVDTEGEARDHRPVRTPGRRTKADSSVAQVAEASTIAQQ